MELPSRLFSAPATGAGATLRASADSVTTQPATTTAFAGVDSRTDAQLPTWYARSHSTSNPDSFAEAVRSLPQAIETEVAYRNRYSDDWIETDRFNAIVEPVRLYEAATGEPDEDPLFHVPTDSYSIINPVDVYGPLEDVLRTEELFDP